MPISEQEVKEPRIRVSRDPAAEAVLTMTTAEKEATLTEHMTVFDPSNEAFEEHTHAIVVGGILILCAALAAGKALGLSAQRHLRNAKGLWMAYFEEYMECAKRYPEPAAFAAALGHMEEGNAVGDSKRGEESDKVKRYRGLMWNLHEMLEE